MADSLPHPYAGRPGLRPARRRQDGDPLHGAAGRQATTCRWPTRPGVARVCEAIAADPSLTRHYTWVPNTVAVVTDGTAVLGLGDIGPAAAMPVMEGKAVLFKQFGGVDAIPICLDTTDVEEIIETVVRLAPSFGGINLEDISAPRCFEIESPAQGPARHPGLPRRPARHGRGGARRAHQRAAADRPRPATGTRVVISGAGAAGVAVARILLEAGVSDLAVLDRQGVLNSERHDLTPVKRALAVDTADHFGRRGTPRRRDGRRRRLHRRQRRHGARGGRGVDGRRRDRLRPGQPQPRGPPRRRPPPRPGRRHRPLGLPQPDQQRARVPRASSAAPSTSTPRRSPRA